MMSWLTARAHRRAELVVFIPLDPEGGPWGPLHGRRRLLAMAKVVTVGQHIGERVLVLVRWGVHLFGRHHFRRRVAVGHGAHARWRGCPLQAVIPHAGGIAQRILEAQEVVDGVRVALRHAHEP